MWVCVWKEERERRKRFSLFARYVGQSAAQTLFAFAISSRSFNRRKISVAWWLPLVKQSRVLIESFSNQSGGISVLWKIQKKTKKIPDSLFICAARTPSLDLFEFRRFFRCLTSLHFNERAVLVLVRLGPLLWRKVTVVVCRTGIMGDGGDDDLPVLSSPFVQKTPTVGQRRKLVSNFSFLLQQNCWLELYSDAAIVAITVRIVAVVYAWTNALNFKQLPVFWRF